MGGEESFVEHGWIIGLGLPPRGRGRALLVSVNVPGGRITPAWAGKRRRRRGAPGRGGDYPRVGGEEATAQRRTSVLVGLPPRGRGRAPPQRKRTAGTRITPAWAGKRVCSRSRLRRRWDYPRVGGEEVRWARLTIWLMGLPPRGRGRDTALICWLGRGRITPAWAGKRPFRRLLHRPARDYPRVGGEEFRLVDNPAGNLGLPPRGRGRDKQTVACGTGDRITPAWAGKSSQFGLFDSDGTDYPRVGGEEKEAKSCAKCQMGLPPRGRGRAAHNG